MASLSSNLPDINTQEEGGAFLVTRTAREKQNEIDADLNDIFASLGVSRGAPLMESLKPDFVQPQPKVEIGERPVDRRPQESRVKTAGSPSVTGAAASEAATTAAAAEAAARPATDTAAADFEAEEAVALDTGNATLAEMFEGMDANMLFEMGVG